MISSKVGIVIFLLLCIYKNSFALDCKDGGDTTADMKECARKELEQQTKKLNRAYNTYGKLLDPKQQKALRTVQLAWIRYKDLRCDFESSLYEGGTMAGLATTNCLINITNQRLKEFENYLKEYASR